LGITSLETYVSAHARLAAEETLKVAADILPAIAELHDAGYILNDIQPRNLLLVDGRWRLASTGRTQGSIAAHRPHGQRVLPRERSTDPSADLFAVGRVLFLALTGVDAPRFEQFAQGRNPPAAEGGWVLELREIIRVACQLEPERRYASAAEMLESVERARWAVDSSRERSVAHGGLPGKAAERESQLENGMITCEASAAVAAAATRSKPAQRPKPQAGRERAGECPRPEQLLNLFSDKANEECAALWLHLTECRKCRAAFQPILFDTIRDEDLREAEEQLEFATPRPGVCPAVEELANYAVWPACDPILPRQLSDGRRAAISAHLERGCRACGKQVEIAKHRAARRDHEATLARSITAIETP